MRTLKDIIEMCLLAPLIAMLYLVGWIDDKLSGRKVKTNG